MKATLDRWFSLKERDTTVQRELLGGATTFAAMAYIIVVNPAILQEAGIDPRPSTVATILTAVFGTLLMGLYANRPIAVAPYMGENAFIAFTLSTITIDGVAISWQERLGTVFVSGFVFLLLTLARARTWLAQAISPSMKHSFAIGIGLFLLLIGMNSTGIVTNFVTGMPLQALKTTSAGLIERPDVPLKLGVWDVKVGLAIGGFLLMAVLLYWNVRGAILLGIITTAVAGYFLGVGELPSAVVASPLDYELDKIAFKLEIIPVLRLGFLHILMTLFLVSFLDTLGTLVGVGAAGNMLTKDGEFPQIERPMMVDSLSCMFAALVGTSTSGAFIESAAGIRDGARTGLAAVTTAALFALSLFFIPLFEPLQNQKLAYAYGPALMAVGLIMAALVKKLEVDDLTELVPGVVTIVMMVFTYNIANGLTAGLVVYPLMKIAAGRWRELHPGSLLLAVLCALYFIFGLPH